MCNVLIVDVEVFGWEEEVANVNGLDNIGGGGILHSPRLLLLPVGGFVTGRFCQSLHYDIVRTLKPQHTKNQLSQFTMTKNNRSTITPTFGTTATNQQ